MKYKTLENRAFDFQIRVINIDNIDWYVLEDFLESIKSSLKTGPATSNLRYKSDMKILQKKEWNINTSSTRSSFIVVTLEGINDIVNGMPASEMAIAFSKWLKNSYEDNLMPGAINSFGRLLSYEGNNIEINDKGMWNATQMAKPFGKSLKDWLRTESTKRYISVMSERLNLLSSDLVSVTYGNDGGTWIHEKLVVKLAQWLNVEFEIWCHTQIETLMREGKVELTKPESLLDWMKLAVMTEEKRLALERENEKMKPIVEYHDVVMKSNGTYTVTQIAKELGLPSASKLNQILNDEHVQYKSGKQWVLYSEHCGKGYTDTITATFEKNNMTFSNTQTVWTEKGRKFIHELLSKDNVRALNV